MKLNKASMIVASSILSIGMFSSMASGTTFMNGEAAKTQIKIASTENVYAKEDLIKKFRTLFPGQFDFLSNNDFQMNSAHIYPEDESVRYDLYFTKTINGKRISGNVGFVGEDLDIQHFSYHPANVTDALFPSKVSKDEARGIAESFMKKFSDRKDYQLETDTFNYYPQQILTEPIRYSFTFARTENEVSIADQRMEVTVLGNGDIVGFYNMFSDPKASTFEGIAGIKEKAAMVKKVKENLSVQLNYQINYDFQSNNRSVELIYQPMGNLQGIQAATGKWMTANGYEAGLPAKTTIEKITANPLPAKQDGITIEEAKKIAEQFLAIDSDKVTLKIESIQEMDNYNGQPVIYVQYMYQYANGGSGSGLEINKNTGEIMSYYNMTDHLLMEIGELPQKEGELSKEKALIEAVKSLKEWSPSILHNYAMPIEEPYFDERLGSYQFAFPRIMNGIVVIGDQINVGIAADGSLNSMSVSYQEIEDWPSSDEVISKQQAKKILEEALSLKLTYMKHAKNQTENHYDLIYLPVFNENPFSYLNAATGEWNLSAIENPVVIEHPWAEEELNYLINANVLSVKDAGSFNGDAVISKGEALKVLMNSLTYFYYGGYYPGQENTNQTFENIDPKHPLYQEIERAVEAGILKADSNKFDVDSPITREELSIWMIRILGLEQAAKDSSIYKLNFVDADQVHPTNIGYVAMANSMGLLKAEENQFEPGREVTYAELAVSTIRLARNIVESGRGLQY